MNKSKEYSTTVWTMLGKSKARLEREHRLVQRAGVKPGDETYDLFVAIAALPAAIRRMIIALLAVACAVLCCVIVAAYISGTPKGVWVVPNTRGTVVIIDVPKGVEQVSCIDSRHLCLQVMQ